MSKEYSMHLFYPCNVCDEFHEAICRWAESYEEGLREDGRNAKGVMLCTVGRGIIGLFNKLHPKGVFDEELLIIVEDEYDVEENGREAKA